MNTATYAPHRNCLRVKSFVLFASLHRTDDHRILAFSVSIYRNVDFHIRNQRIVQQNKLNFRRIVLNNFSDAFRRFTHSFRLYTKNSHNKKKKLCARLQIVYSILLRTHTKIHVKKFQFVRSRCYSLFRFAFT